MERKDELEAQVRKTSLRERLDECRTRIGKMCSEGRPPRMCIPVQWDDDDFYISTTLADAQRALDAEREKVAKLEKIQAIDLKNNNEYREQLATLQAQLRQVEGERDTARRRVDELEAREVDVVTLREDLEQRTAELEAANGSIEAARRVNNDLQAKLERVRGELVEATHNANVYQSLYSTGCMDRALLENELRDLRALILALPKMEGDVEVYHHESGLRHSVVARPANKYYSSFDTPEEAGAYAAILKHRQGMEG